MNVGSSFEEKLNDFIKMHNIHAEHLQFDKAIHTVQDTLRVTEIDLKYITKSMIFKDRQGRTIVGMVPAEFRVSISQLCRAVDEDIELCSPKESLERTGYPVGGMPCFGYDAIVVIDNKVFENEHIYTGGGSEFSLVKISTEEVRKIINPIIAKIRGNKSN
ncbi:YbaK/EbsC family protein [archaeon]|nr:MAG: YbaK/EbsC family protein [archaeon]